MPPVSPILSTPNFTLDLSQPSSDATFSSLRSLFSTLFFFQHARWKRKVDRWKGWFQGVCGEDSKIPQRKGWPAGQHILVFFHVFCFSLLMALGLPCRWLGVRALGCKTGRGGMVFFCLFFIACDALELSSYQRWYQTAHFILAFSCHTRHLCSVLRCYPATPHASDFHLYAFLGISS